MSKIMNVIPNDDYTLFIELDNMHKIIYDMKPRLKAVRFFSLAEMEKFKSVKIEDENTLVWDSLYQITIDEIINIIER